MMPDNWTVVLEKTAVGDWVDEDGEFIDDVNEFLEGTPAGTRLVLSMDLSRWEEPEDDD